MGGYALGVSRLGVAYENKVVLEDVTFKVPEGAMVGIVGPNGGGKSTLIKAVLGLVASGHGEIKVLGQPVQRVRRMVGYVPQREDVDWNFPVNVFDVVLMGRVPPRRLFWRPSDSDRKLVNQALRDVGMEGHASEAIGELSGGQQQRVFLARALAQGAQVLLLDEPVSGIDAKGQHEIFGLLRRLQQDGKTILVTTHDLSCVTERFNLALLLNRQVVAFGPPDEVFTQELLNKTYQSHLMLLRRGESSVSAEEGARERAN